MPETVFPRWRFSLIFIFLLADALYLPASPGELWLSILLAGIVASLLLYVLRKLLGTADLLNLPGWGGRLCGIVLAALAAFMVLHTLGRLTAFFERTSFPTMPALLTGVLTLLFALPLARIGTTRLSTWALPSLIAVLVPLLLSLLLTVPDWEIRALLPLLPEGPIGLARTALHTLRYTYAPLFFLYLLLQHQEPQQKHTFTPGVLCASVVMSVTCARNLMLLGVYAAARVPYPTYTAAGLVTVGDFFQRAETLIAGCLTVCELGRIAVLLLVAAAGLRTALRGIFPRKTNHTEHTNQLQEE
ncbi:MAG: GerAB/ArcD/ProY family transporter [Intestinibacillus sp.]